MTNDFTKAPRRPARVQRGFTLVELMIASAVGLIVLAGMATLFVSNSRAQTEIEKANRQIENGRFAMDLLTADLRNAGYYGEFDPTPMGNPAAMPDPCDTDLADIRTALPLAVQGIDNAAAGTSVSCLTDIKGGTDIVVIRRVETCYPGEGSCEPETAQGAFLQASLCNNPAELGSGDPDDYYDLDTNTTSLTRHTRTCPDIAGSKVTALAKFRRFLTYIYYVANNDNAGDGIPTLKRATMTSAGNVIKFEVQPLAEGVDNLQLEYGLDLVDAVSPAPAAGAPVPAPGLMGDGIADTYHATPASAAACADVACTVNNWRSVVSVKVNLLARNIDTTAYYQDKKSYVLGNKADGTKHVIAAANDGYKRHVFQSLVNLPNPAGRRAK